MQKKKAPPVVSDINVTPMVDKGQSVDLPRAKAAIAMKAADKEDAILVAITKNGDVFLSPGNTRVKPEDLPGKVKDFLTNKLDKTVYIKSDQRAKYERVMDVVDNLRAAGVDQLGLLTEQVQNLARPADQPPAK